MANTAASGNRPGAIESRICWTTTSEPFSALSFRLAEKLRYLADAPQQDPEGNKTMVRFSRKTKQQYVASEKDGKATGWSAFYIDGKWTEAKK